MFSDIAEKNLKKDKRVLGKKWTTTYGGYFSDPENIHTFIDAASPHLPSISLDVLYAASAAGLLGEELIRRLGAGNLTLVDISQEHLDQNGNPQTTKICADLLTMDLGKTFDLIIMRSSLDYFPSEDLQIEVLKNIKTHLKNGGLFINQPAYIPTLSERDLMSRVYQDIEKIGDRYFQSIDLEKIYHQAGFSKFKKIGEGKMMILTEKEHRDRYGITKTEIAKIQQMIPERASSMQITTTGYRLTFQFPIFLAS
jgi:SAM-dependent methyltransferase